MVFRRHRERHRTSRIGWLRAAVLGANDGIVSTASLVAGVAAANASHSDLVIAAIAALVAGAMSMAAGEYVSVHSQADTERADLERERRELHADIQGERNELTAIYVRRGLDASLARQVADQLMAHDALGARARRARHFRDGKAASDSGGARVRGELLGRRRAATRRDGALTGRSRDSNRLRDVARLSRDSRRHRRACGWRENRDWRLARHVLGCARDGGHRGDRRVVRDDEPGRLNAPTRNMTS